MDLNKLRMMRLQRGQGDPMAAKEMLRGLLDVTPAGDAMAMQEGIKGLLVGDYPAAAGGAIAALPFVPGTVGRATRDAVQNTMRNMPGGMTVDDVLNDDFRRYIEGAGDLMKSPASAVKQFKGYLKAKFGDYRSPDVDVALKRLDKRLKDGDFPIEQMTRGYYD